jgi:predicted nucleotidyltransferase
MVNIDELKPLIVEKLKPLNPDKIILFGSHAYGTPTEESDIDLFIQKDIDPSEVSSLQVKAGVKLFDIIKRYKIGFDVFVDSEERSLYRLNDVKDQFYSDIYKRGKVIYAK